MIAFPPAVDSSSEASTDSKGQGHPYHRGKAGRSPRGLIKKGRGDGVISALSKVSDEGDSLRVEGSTRAYSDDYQAHVGSKVSVLVAARVSRNGKVGRETRSVSMVSCNVSRASSIKGLDVDKDIGVWLVIVAKNDIRGMRDGIILHPLVHGPLASVTAPFSGDS